MTTIFDKDFIAIEEAILADSQENEE